MSAATTNGNGAIPNKVLGWAVAGLAVVGGPFWVLWGRMDVMESTLAAHRDTIRAAMAGQDVMLQREMQAGDRETLLRAENARLHAEIARIEKGK